MGTTSASVRATVSSLGNMPPTIAPESQGSDNGHTGAVDQALAQLVEAFNWRELQRADGRGMPPGLWSELRKAVQCDWFVIVPLDWCTWDRARLLRLAAEGTVTDEPSSDADEDFIRSRAPRYQGWARLDVGWPELPPERARDAALMHVVRE